MPRVRVELGLNPSGLPCVDWIDGTEVYWLPLWEACASSIRIDPATLTPSIDFSRPVFRQFPPSFLKQVVVVIPSGVSL